MRFLGADSLPKRALREIRAFREIQKKSYEEFQLSFGADQSPQSSTKRNRKAPMCVRPVKRSRGKLESEFGASSTVESPSPAREESYCV